MHALVSFQDGGRCQLLVVVMTTDVRAIHAEVVKRPSSNKKRGSSRHRGLYNQDFRSVVLCEAWWALDSMAWSQTAQQACFCSRRQIQFFLRSTIVIIGSVTMAGGHYWIITISSATNVSKDELICVQGLSVAASEKQAEERHYRIAFSQKYLFLRFWK